MAAKPCGDIWDILALDGVATHHGKMVCPICKKDNITVSANGEVAKCWSDGCKYMRTIHSQRKINTSAWSWDSILMQRLAASVKQHLQEDEEGQDYLVDRGLPPDLNFFFENDLGTIPPNIDSLVKKCLADAAVAIDAELKAPKEYVAEWTDGKQSKVSQQRGDAKKKILAQIDQSIALINATEEAFKRVTETIALLTTEHRRGALCFVYRSRDGLVSSINVRQYKTEYQTDMHDFERDMIRIQPHRRGVFLGASLRIAPGTAWGKHIPPCVIVEGEFNALALNAAIANWGGDYFIPVMAVGGKNGADVACIQSLIDWNEDPLVIYDNDKINPSTGMPGGYSFVKELSESMFLHATTTPTKDLDDWFTEEDRTPRNFIDTLIKPRVGIAMPFEAVAENIQALLESPGEMNRRMTAVNTLIIRDLERRGKFYLTDGYTSILMRYQAEDRLLPVRHGTPRFLRLMTRYGLVTPNYVDAGGKAINIASLGAPIKTMHSLAYFTSENTLYLNCYDDTMLRISPDGSVKRLSNGSDGVLMIPPDPSLDPWLPDDIDLDAELKRRKGTMLVVPGSTLSKQILDTVNYETNPDHYKQILKCFLLSIFFGSAHESRPTLVAEGPPGSGKSTVGKLIGIFLMSKSYSVSQTPTTANQLAERLQSTPFVAIDDWQKASPEVEKEFCTLTTGGKHRRRELYTTSQEVELPCTACIFLTTNQNPMKSDGTSRRLLTIPVEERQKKVGDRVYKSVSTSLLPEFIKHRTTLWLDMLADLIVVVKAHANTDPHATTACSMADFGVMVQRTADYEGWTAKAQDMFKILGHEQDQFELESLKLGSLIPIVMRFEDNREKWWTAKELSDAVSAHIPDNDIELKKTITPNYMGTMLKTKGPLFSRIFGMERKKDTHDKIWRYRFRSCAVEPTPIRGFAAIADFDDLCAEQKKELA